MPPKPKSVPVGQKIKKVWNTSVNWVKRNPQPAAERNETLDDIVQRHEFNPKIITSTTAADGSPVYHLNITSGTDAELLLQELKGTFEIYSRKHRNTVRISIYPLD